MYIEFLAPSPKAGQHEHVAREIGNPLVAAGFAKEVPTPVAPPRVEFGLFRGALSSTPLGIYCRCSKCGRRDDYIGASDAESIAQNFLARLCIHAKNLQVPEDVREAYARERAKSAVNGGGWRAGVPGINAASKNTGESIR